MTKGRPQFVSAQPDEPWFVWQTHVYVRNFLDRGVDGSQITALFGIAPGAGVSDELVALRSQFPTIDIQVIEDERDDLGRSYPPSIQPHLIEKWLIESPQRHGEATFFHDCDIILRRIPDFAKLLDDASGGCVLSDSTKYIGYEYLHEACEKIQAEVPGVPDDDLLERMCSVVGIDPEIVREQRTAGGAQYLLTGVGPSYWAKVYDDSLALRRLFHDYGDEIGLGQPVEDFVQIWTAGMWAYLWNLWAAGHTTVVSAEMDFLFSGDWLDEHAPIIHMAGKSIDRDGAHFDKGDWREQNPIQAVKQQPYLFDHLPAASASAEYARAIHAAAEIAPPGSGDCEPALYWRILAWRSGPYDEMWDVERVYFGFDGTAQIVDHLSSGFAGPGFEVGNAFAEGARFWGGRPAVRDDAAPELYVGVRLDAAGEPMSISLLHAPGEHRPKLVLVQRSDDGVKWITTHVAPTPPPRREQTLLYRVPSVQSAAAWRLVGTTPSQGFAWDVGRVRFLLDGCEQRGSLSSSGDAGESFNADKVTANDVSVWGGRPDGDGRFHLTVSSDDGLEIDRIVLDQGADHWMSSVELQYLSEGDWKTWRRFDLLTPGVNELFLYDRPPTLLAEPAEPLNATAAAPRRTQPRRQPSQRSASNDLDPFADRRILVLIAAYRDPELANTIANALAQAAYPEHVRFAICNQYDEETVDIVDQWKNDPRFSIDEVPFADSQGCGWARHRTFALFDDEPYILQIDAHTRFAARWDVRYIDQLESIGVELPILTTYPPRYRLVDGEVEYDTEVGVQRLTIVELRDDLTTLQKTEPVVDLEWPGPSPTIAAGQIFTRGRFCRDIDYDPHMYFAGEEISLAARAFTSGYDLFHPTENLIWHLYDHDQPKHWDDHDDHHAAHAASVQRLTTLFRGDAGELGRFGLGTARSLAEFEDLAGVDLRGLGKSGSLAGARNPVRAFRVDGPQYRPTLLGAQPNGAASPGSGAFVVHIDRSIIEPRDDYVAFVVVLLDRAGSEVSRAAIHAPDVLNLTRATVTLRDIDRTDAVSYLIVPTTRTGSIGEIAVRSL